MPRLFALDCSLSLLIWLIGLFFCVFIEFQNNKSLPDKKNEVAEFDPAKHSLVFYGHAYTINKLDDDNLIVIYLFFIR